MVGSLRWRVGLLGDNFGGTGLQKENAAAGAAAGSSVYGSRDECADF